MADATFGADCGSPRRPGVVLFPGEFPNKSLGDDVASEPGILAVAAAGLREALAQAGVVGEALIRAAGLEPESFDDPTARISLRRFVHLLELAAEKTGDDCFGLHLGAAYPLSKAGVFGYVLLNSPTVGVALENLLRYIPFQVDSAELELREAGSDILLCYRLVDPEIGPRRHYNERSMAITLVAFRTVLASDWSPKAVRFEHVFEGDASAHARLFGAPVAFAQGTNAIVFPRRLLDRKIAAADPHLLKVLEQHIEDLLSRLPAGRDIEHDLRHYVTKSLKNGPPRLGGAARHLGMSPRTLQRRLKDRGVVFDRLIDEARRQLAQSYLTDSDLTVSEIAYLLGYSELSAFTRAYRRWTGSTPKASRRRIGG